MKGRRTLGLHLQENKQNKFMKDSSNVDALKFVKRERERDSKIRQFSLKRNVLKGNETEI